MIGTLTSSMTPVPAGDGRVFLAHKDDGSMIVDVRRVEDKAEAKAVRRSLTGLQDRLGEINDIDGLAGRVSRYAADRGMPTLGRGSAANSLVSYLLGITHVDPMKHNLFFERFLNEGRVDPPDIDVDFEHERREEVIQYIYRKYGRDRAARATRSKSPSPSISAGLTSARYVSRTIRRSGANSPRPSRFSIQYRSSGPSFGLFRA